MSLTYKLQKKGIEFLLDKTLKYIDKDPHGNLVKMSYKIEPIFNKIFPPENFKKIQSYLNNWNYFYSIFDWYNSKSSYKSYT